MPPHPNATPPANSATMRAFVHWIRAAAPYVHAFRGKTFVIAFGGEVVADDAFLGIIHDLNLLHSLGIQLVVVHGCRPQVEAILDAQDIPSRYAHGVRVTDADAMDCVLEAAGQVRARIEALLSLGLANSPMAGARNRVSSGNYLTAKPMGVRRRHRHAADRRSAPHRHRGDPAAARRRRHRADLADRLFADGRDLQPHASRKSRRRSPCGWTRTKLIFLMDTDGVRNGRRQLLTDLSTTDAEALLAQAASKLPPDVRLYLPARDPRVRQRRQARAPHQPPPRRRAAARALHARRRGHDDRVDARSRTCATRRSTTSAASSRSSSRSRSRACSCAARASGWKREIERFVVAEYDNAHHRLRRAVRVSRGEGRRARRARRAAGFPPRRLRRGADARDRERARAS